MSKPLKEDYIIRIKSRIEQHVKEPVEQEEKEEFVELMTRGQFVIVDLRPDSPTFGQWRGFHLTGENTEMLLVPQYFGHGYLVIEDSVVSYKCAEVFYGEGDSGIMYNDPDIGIEWPFELIGGKENLIISEKDLHLMSFADYKKL